jgi:hypothetical protein
MEKPNSRTFFDKRNAAGRQIYFKTLGGGIFAVIVAIFLIISIYWGSLWKTPVRPLDGWVIVSTDILMYKHSND